MALVVRLLAAFAVLAAPAEAATVTVSSSSDALAEDGTCTLREAITATNSNAAVFTGAGECAAGEAAPVRDVIEFAIGAGVQSIAPGAELPVITDQLEIDGSQGAEPEAAIRIELDGSGVAEGRGLMLTTGSDGSYVHNIAVYDFPSDGIELFSDENVVEWAIVGMDQGGAEAKGNGDDGISIRGTDNLVSQSAVSGNDNDGIEINPRTGGSGAGNTIRATRVGTNKTGTAEVGNGAVGIHLLANAGEANAAGTTIGGPEDPTPGGACDGDCNLISGNDDDGIEVRVGGSDAPLTTGLLIEGNYVGTDATGLAAVANGATTADAGVLIWGATEAATIHHNLISGNYYQGITIQAGSSGLGARDTTIAGNTIGLGADGDTVVANSGYGIKIDRTLTNGPEIAGTTIGGPEDPTPGGACDGDCNLISGNNSIGIVLFENLAFAGGPITATEIVGNYVGTDVTGTLDRGHFGSGVQISGASDGVVGEPGAPNVISGNGASGIALTDGATGNTIQSNLIGLAADGVTPLGNGDNGIEADESAGSLNLRNTIGGIGGGLGNRIAHNGLAGVALARGNVLDTPILGNSIFLNGTLGIDLQTALGGVGVTENGACEEAAGANRCQEFPALSAAIDEGSTVAAGILASDPGKRFRIELFASDEADPSGNGEGERLLGVVETTTDGAGDASWFFIDPAATLAGGEFATATATELAGDGTPLSTSEFSDGLAAPTCDLMGDGGPNPLAGGAADDVICGFGGADTISGGVGRNAILAGEGDDMIDVTGGSADVLVDCGPGTDTVTADAEGTDPAAIFVGCETVTRPVPVGGPEESPLPAKAYKCKGKKATIVGTGKKETIKGTKKADVIVALGGNDTIRGLGGNDTICGGNGSDTIKAGPGNDLTRGEAGNDRLLGEKGNDRLDGGNGRDVVKGGSGNDRLKGAAGKGDLCDGQSGKKDRLDGKKAGCEKRKRIP